MFNSSLMVPAALDISKEHSTKNVKPAGKGSSASQTERIFKIPVECHTGKGFMKKFSTTKKPNTNGVSVDKNRVTLGLQALKLAEQKFSFINSVSMVTF